MNTNNNPPAFPGVPYDYTWPDGSHNKSDGGMALRDYFAAAALAPLIEVSTVSGRYDVDARVCAENAYKIADAMLAQRNPQTPKTP